jgi:hypothetical protein
MKLGLVGRGQGVPMLAMLFNIYAVYKTMSLDYATQRLRKASWFFGSCALQARSRRQQRARPLAPPLHPQHAHRHDAPRHEAPRRRSETAHRPAVLRTDRTRRVPHPVLIGHAA